MGKGAPQHKSRGSRKGGGGSSGTVGVSKKSKRGANRGGGGKDSNFAEVSVRQKNSTLLKRESTMRLMRIKALGRKVEKNEEDLRCFIENPKPIVRKGYDPAMRGMKLTGPARPAIDIEPSDHGCGLRLFECRERCVRDADIPVELDLFEKFETNGNFASHPATLQHLQLLQSAGDACREHGHLTTALEHYERAMVLDVTDACAIRPRLVALLMDSGDAARARQLIQESTSTSTSSSTSTTSTTTTVSTSTSNTAATNVTYQWTLFLVEFIAHYLLKEEDSSAEIVMRALENAMACNPHVGLFLAVPNLFEEVVDIATLLQEIEHHHHTPEKKKATPISVALAYAIDQFGCWRDAGNEEENIDIRTYVYETAIHQHYSPLDYKDWSVSPIKLVRATYGEFVLRLEEDRSRTYNVSEADAVIESVA